MRTVDLIHRKRDGEELAPEEIQYLIDGYTRGDIPDYQISAFLMATYFSGMSDREVSVMTESMVKKFRQEWASLQLADPSVQNRARDIVTLASLVERETPRPEERPHVAGVFTNRLRVGQPLQCDPTVTYALTLAGAYSGKLAGADLRFPSPYNTYRNRGLPPGPIANPGEAALRAALDPPPTDDLYFVANTEGGHFFSKTLKEHNRNVARYRRLLQQSQNPQASGTSTAPAAKQFRPARLP